MMQVNSRDRLGYADALKSTRLVSRSIYVCLPTFTDGDYDDDHDSSADPTSATNSGLGRSATWKVLAIYANVRDVDASLVQFGQAPAGAVVGDTLISFDIRHKTTMQSVFDTKESYISIDGRRLRPTSPLQVAGVGQIEEYAMVLSSYQALFTATGY